jgi:putative resolvase
MSTHLKISEVSKMLGGDNQTIRAWVDSGKLKCFRTPNGHRRFDKAYMERVLSGGADMQNMNNEKELFIYARVSTRKQADAGNLDRQVSRLTQHAIQKGYKVSGIYQEIASGNHFVEDLIAITTSFSARIYGKRGGKKVANQMEKIIARGEKENENNT